MKKILLLLSIISSFSMADMILGGEINVGGYSHTPKGTIAFENEAIDVVDTLKWENKTDVFASLYFEHPIPVIPNIKVGVSTLSHDGKGGVDKAFNFGGKEFRSGFSVTTGIDLNMLDGTLYYEIFDNDLLVFDIGVTAKYIDGNVYINSPKTVRTDAVEESTDFKGTLPLLYSKLRIGIPTTNIALQVEANVIAYEENLLYDVEAGFRYILFSSMVLGDMGAEVGYKQIKLKIDDIEGFTMDVDFSGVYGKLVWDF